MSTVSAGSDFSQDVENLPKPSVLVSHELGNKMAKIHIPPDWDGEDRELLWDEYDKAVESLDDFKSAANRADLDEMDDAYGRFMGLLEDGSTPDYARDTLIDAGRNFEGIRSFVSYLSEEFEDSKELWSEDLEQDVELGTDDSSTDIDRVLDDFYDEENAEVVPQDIDGTVRGGEYLQFISSTVIKNSYEHGSKGVEDPDIRVDVEENESSYELSIWDTGPGIESYTELEDVYRIGYGDNTGIGLGMAKMLANIAGGDLEYDPMKADEEDVGFAQRLVLEKSG